MTDGQTDKVNGPSQSTVDQIFPRVTRGEPASHPAGFTASVTRHKPNATSTTRELVGNLLRGPSPERNIAVEIGRSGGPSLDCLVEMTVAAKMTNAICQRARKNRLVIDVVQN